MPALGYGACRGVGLSWCGTEWETPGVARMIYTDDVGDPRLDDFRELSTADRRPDRPGGRGFVIAEGTVVVRRLLASAYPVRALLGIERRVRELADELATSGP